MSAPGTAARVLHAIIALAVLIHVGRLAWSLFRSAPAAIMASCRCFSIRPWKPAFTSRTATNMLDAEVHQRMQKLRRRSGEIAVAWLSPSLGFTLLWFIIVGEMRGGDDVKAEDKFDFHYFMLMLVGAVGYIGCVLVYANVLTLKSSYVHVAYAVVMSVMTVRVVFTRDDAKFFLLAAFRMVFRMVGGLILLDYKKAVVWNVPLSLVVCLMFKHNVGSLKCAKIPDDTGILWTVQEVFALFATIGTLYCAEWWQYKCVNATVMARNIESARQSVHSLLTVFCDSVVHLGPDGSILKPAPELAHLLCISNANMVQGSCAVVDAINSLVGHNLVNHIAKEDKRRFLDFIALAQHATESGLQTAHEIHRAQPEDILESNVTWAGGPPGAIHLNMNSPFRPAFPVDVFAVHFRDTKGQVGHLVGIRDAGSHGIVPEAAMPAARDSSDVVHAVRRRAQARTSPAPSSNTSSVSLNVAEPFEISRVVCEFEAGSEEFNIRACNLRLAPVRRPATADAASVDTQQQKQQQHQQRRRQQQQQQQDAAAPAVVNSRVAPDRRRRLKLTDLITSPSQRELMCWIQAQANALVSGDPPSDLEGVRLHLCQPHLSMNLALVASCASVDFLYAESDEGSDGGDTHPLPENLPMLLQLDGLIGRRHAGHRSRGSSVGSNSSKSSRSSSSSRGPRMPSIEEHPAGHEDAEEQWSCEERQEQCRSASQTAEQVAGSALSPKTLQPPAIMHL